MATYVAIDTNIPGGERFEVDAHFKEGRWELTPVNAPPERLPTFMEDADFQKSYEPATTPPHSPGDPTPAPLV